MEERKINVPGDLDETISTLIEYRQRGENVYCDFNGHILHSRNITVDSGYLEVTGYTKEDYEAKLKEMMDARKIRMQKEAKQALERIPEWIERGRAIIPSEKYDEWAECVNARANDLYHGDDLEQALEIMEMLHRQCPISDAISKLEQQNNSAISYNVVCSIIYTFSERSAEFFRCIHPEFEEVKPRHTLEETVDLLLDIKKSGDFAYCDFNGHLLRSDNISMDRAFLIVTGMTKEEHDRKRREYIERLNIEEENRKSEALERIPEWIERGKPMIYPERHEDWIDCVNSRAKDLYNGSDLDDALDLMTMLENNSPIEEVLKRFQEQNHSGFSAAMVRRIVFAFSKRGPEFYEAAKADYLTTEEMEAIEDKRRENAGLEELHKQENGPKL